MNSLKAIFSTFMALFIALSPTPALAAEPFDFLKPYERLLQIYVFPLEKEGIKGTGVNYLDWGKNPRHKETLTLLQNAKTENLKNKEEEIAFWINAYNFMVIDLIISQGERESVQNLGGELGDPWNEYSWKIGGEELTINQVQTTKLLALDEYRVHYALSCGTLSCPNLENTPYYSERIYSRLENSAKRFIENPTKGVKISGKKYSYNLLFEWYENDFPLSGPEGHINRYIPLEDLEFSGTLPFNWKLNALWGKEPAAPAKR